MSSGNSADDSRKVKLAAPFTKVVTFWIPRRFLTSTGADVQGFAADMNDKILRRGYVLSDSQILTTTIGPASGIELIFEGEYAFEAPERRDWQAAHREYFGLDNPYQMAEDHQDFTHSHIMTRVREPYLFSTELIAAVLHGVHDNCYFYCPCHCADVVYTTKHRLICMGCGAMHAVLDAPLTTPPKRLLTAQQWSDFFDEGGSRCEEEIEMSFVDFREVESAKMLWTTQQWDEARHRFMFFARSPPNVIANALRNTESDPSILLEAGFEPVALVPPPAYQLSEDSIDLDLIENACHALRAGVTGYLAASKTSDELLNAIPQLFRAVELLLKAKLQRIVARALDDHPNNPTVLKRLQANGVSICTTEAHTLKRLRGLRNSLQHGTAVFNYRAGLSVCRGAIIFLDRFVNRELGLWMGDAISPDEWQRILPIPEISSTADRVMIERIQAVRSNMEATIARCANCDFETLVRPAPGTGAACIRCGYIPTERQNT
jgi:uncharacterized protein YutE (UPF0331/DUF86 family)